MKTAICLALLLGPLLARAENWSEDYTRLLHKYVTAGGVRYAEWHGSAPDRAALDKVVKAIAEEKAAGDNDAKLAFYINAYNANILENVLASYPLKSVRDIAPLFGLFTQKRLTVGGEKMSFDHLEKEVIHGFGDVRIHFALNCASASCPPLRHEAYEGTRLSAQLDEQARAFLNGNPNGLKVSDDGKTAAASKIFDWNEDDFKAAGGTVGFINKYRKPPLAKDVKVSYQDYDWSLNAAK